MRFHDSDPSISLYDYPYVGLFRDYVQTHVPLPQSVAEYQSPEPSSTAINPILNDPLKPSFFQELSLELRKNIFMLACEDGVLAPSKDSSQNQLRLTLQLVCKEWQRIVTSYPALWNDLDLRIMPRRGHSNDVGKVSLADTDTYLDCARSWLTHAGDSLVSLRFFMFPCIEAESPQHRERIMSFLSAYRYKALAIRSPILSMLDFDESLSASLERVETLTLTAPSWDYPETHLFSHRPPFPALRSLSLTVDDRFMSANIVSAFPWHQLQKVTLGTIKQPLLAAEILNKCESLIDCTLHIQEYNESTILSHIYLPRLRHMSIVSNIVGFSDDTVLTATIAPRLESLSVSGLFGVSLLTYMGAGSMAIRSNVYGNLHKLVLKSFDGYVDLGLVLTLFIGLRTVELFNATIDPFTTYCLPHGFLGPRLRELHVSGYDLRPGDLLDMVENRQKNARDYAFVPPFTSVLFSFPSTQFADMPLEYFERAAFLQDEHNFELALGVFQGIPDFEGDAGGETEHDSDDEAGGGPEDGDGQGSENRDGQDSGAPRLE